MNFKGVMKGIGKAFVNYGPMAVGIAAAAVPAGSLAQKAVVPLIGTIVNAIGSARSQGGTGQEQFEAALQSLQVAAPALIPQIEAIFQVDIPDEAYEPYIRGMIQLHYDLLKASGKIASASGK